MNIELIKPRPVLSEAPHYDPGKDTSVPFLLDTPIFIAKHFIEANTIEGTLTDIQNNHIIPVFIKDNEPVISHAEFIEATYASVKDIFHGEAILKPDIRLSHPIKGRVPDAKNKPAIELLEHEKTLYYERMAFVIEIPSISNIVNGNSLHLTVGGVKAYNLDNLNTRSGADQHFKIFIGFENKVCTNLCITSDGYVEDLKVKNLGQLSSIVKDMLTGYDGFKHVKELEGFTQQYITETQFAQLIGRCRMYRHLRDIDKAGIPNLQFGDNQINMICKDYYRDHRFCKDEAGNINLWNLYNLFTNANKSSYIDYFLDRSLNAYEWIAQLSNSLRHKKEWWYLS